MMCLVMVHMLQELRQLDNNGGGQLSWLINGIDWAIANDMDVISLSLGAIYSGSASDQLSSPEVLKVEEAIANGITVVVASGNCAGGLCDSFDCVTTPGIARNAITVGAVDSDSNWAHFSSGCYINDYIKPDLVAPGVNIYSSVPSGYDYKSGTSMATPFVTGSVALIGTSYSPLEIKSILESNALDLGPIGKDVQYGSGLLNLDGVLDAPNEPPSSGEDYTLSIPLFEINKEGVIILEYFNSVDDKPRKITIDFDLEELDTHIVDTETNTIPFDKSKTFKLKFTPHLSGKHLLKIKISEDSIVLNEFSVPVNVASNIMENKFASVEVKGG